MIKVIISITNQKNRDERIEILRAAFTKIVKRAKKEKKVWLAESRLMDFWDDHITFALDIYKSAPIWSFAPYKIILRVEVRPRKIVAELSNLTILDIVKTELANATKQMNIDTLVILTKE